MKLADLFKLGKKKEQKKAMPKAKPKEKAKPAKKAAAPKKVVKQAKKPKDKPKQIEKKPVEKKALKQEKPSQPIKRNECPECGSLNVVISKMTGNTICQDCGAIFAGLPPDVEKKIEEVKNQG